LDPTPGLCPGLLHIAPSGRQASAAPTLPLPRG
jgi:hypothetical protein